jgi:hypothetical protein
MQSQGQGGSARENQMNSEGNDDGACWTGYRDRSTSGNPPGAAPRQNATRPVTAAA